METPQSPGISRRGFLQATASATITAPVWLGLGLAATPQVALGGCREASPGSYFFDSFGIGDDTLGKVLSEALKGGGDYADVYLQHTIGNWIVMEDSTVNRAYTSVDLGLGVRVLRGEQTGYAFCQVLELPAMLEAARSAASLARAGGQPAGGRGVEVAALKERPALNLYPQDQPWAKVAMDARIGLLRSLHSRLDRADKRIIKTVLQFSDMTSHLMVATSTGVVRADLRPRTSLMAMCMAQDGSERESNYFDVTSRSGLEFYTPEKIQHVADGAVRRTLELFEARPLGAGEMPCVLAAGSAGILLHEAVGHGLEADFNRRGISTYSGRLGEKVAGPEVTIIDDGTLPHSHGAIAFDDEANDSMRTVLVEKGVLKSFLHDRLSARWFKTKSTGSGRRQSYQHAPMPRMRATFMQPGSHDPGEIIASVKKGIYAEQFTNGQVNIGAGDFSFYVKSGRAIENGKLTYPIKDVNVIGNGPQVLSRISMVGNDLALAEGGFNCGKLGQSVPVSQGLPTTLVSSMNVGGAK